jgi:hypothetical protein
VDAPAGLKAGLDRNPRFVRAIFDVPMVEEERDEKLLRELSELTAPGSSSNAPEQDTARALLEQLR